MNTKNSPIKGKAYEYACVLAVNDIISSIRPVEIVDNSSLDIAKSHFNNDISDLERRNMLLSAKAGVQVIIQMEPRMYDGKDKLTISLQPDTVATKKGDIRDVLIIRRSIKWEIGISLKHNHAALKHSRLSPKIDFGKEWFNCPCSEEYFKEINKIFSFLAESKKQGKKWSDFGKGKEFFVYRPVLMMFMKEFKRLAETKNITSKLIKYLIGSNGRDYYKMIHYDNHIVTITPFNLYGTLNQNGENAIPLKKIPPVRLPKRILSMDFKEKSSSTLILSMDEGWQISFRIHNASTFVEPSLKFDIQLKGQPADLFYINATW